MVPSTSRGRETRARLLRAANLLFGDRGISAVTVDEICAAAGVAKGTFYVHFRQKEDVTFAAFATSMESVAAQVRAWLRQDLPTRQVLCEFAAALGWLGATERTTLMVSIREFLSRPADFAAYQTGAGQPRDQLRPIIERGQQRGEVRAEVEPAAVAALIESAWLGTVLDWAQRRGARDDLVPRLVEALELILDGVAPRPREASP